jgi:hypothetical protein
MNKKPITGTYIIETKEYEVPNNIKYNTKNMSKKQTTPTHGGLRENAGRKSKYGEETVTIAFRIPESIKEQAKNAIQKLLKKHLKSKAP